ncbi:hypothetical protein GOP47_0025433 [Adiantum capillus-veneris]|uniref:Mitochondrial carrier protein n=1 Tax=Adiantum capillus-veneris TaxID=13818 RepID=A0A9D4U247_ADICA|nr:hypothetical protein GOP47_0025433 [Adiantum capillus-veneris]
MFGREQQPTTTTTSTSNPSSSSYKGLVFYPGAAATAASQGNSATQSRFTPDTPDDRKLDFTERAVSAAGAAFLSAIIVNPLDVVKTRLQAQAAGQAGGRPYQDHVRRHVGSLNAEFVCPPVCPRGGVSGVTPLCPPSCFQYNGTFDVFYKIIRQEGILRLWRGTYAGLALAIPTVGIYLPCYDIFRDSLERYSANHYPQLTPYAPLLAGSGARSLACIICSPIELARVRMQAQRELRGGVKPPGMLKTLFGVLKSVSVASGEPLRGVRALWTGVGAQLARDVPFSAICWATLEPLRREFSRSVGSEANAVTVLGSNFTAGVIAGSVAAAATCPLDVAKTRRQIQDPSKVLSKTSTRQVLVQIWREGGLTGLFMGVIPRVARAGPSVGIVVSFYEVVKYAIHKGHVPS